MERSVDRIASRVLGIVAAVGVSAAAGAQQPSIDPGSLFRGIAASIQKQEDLPPDQQSESSSPQALVSPADGELGALLAMLSSDSCEERDRASAALRDRSRAGDADLAGAMRSGALGLEQQERVMEAMRERYMAGPLPALGISMQGVREQPGIAIQTVQPQFPAANVLKPLDIVLAADGVEFPAMSDTVALARVILSHDPGDTIPLRILRGEQELVVEAPLGRHADLQNLGDARGGSPPPAALESAWALRLERLGLGAERLPVVRVLASRDLWVRDVRASANPGPGEGLVPGGSRGTFSDPGAAANAAITRIRVQDGMIDGRANKGNRVNIVVNGLDAQAAQREIQALAAQIAGDQAAIQDPALTPAARQAIIDRLADSQRRIARLRGALGR